MLAWQESAGFIFDVNPCRSPKETPFHARIESYNFGSLVTSVCDSVGSTWNRTPLDAARNGVDHFMVQFYLRGKGAITHTDEELITDVGDIFILDASRTINTINSDFANFTLWIPRNLLEPALPDPDAIHGKILPASLPICTILRSHMMLLHEQAGNMTRAQGRQLTQPTIDLVTAALDGCAEQSDDTRQATRSAALLTIKRYINRHLDSPALTPQHVAQAVNVSRATLYRICEPLGGINQYIRQQRLRRVLNALMNPDLNHLSICQIASYWGFDDASSFTRIFRRDFGVTPGEARQYRTYNIPVTNVDQQNGLNVGDRHYEQWLTGMIA